MTIELPSNAGGLLEDLTERHGREIKAITDLDASDVAEAQMALLGEFDGIPEWKGRGGVPPPRGG